MITAMQDSAAPPVSKTKRKKEMLELQQLGIALVELPESQLGTMDIAEALREAVLAAKRITAHEGKRRQLQYIGRLMRDVDPEPIRTIVPGQSDDQAGLSAMQILLPTDSPRHFLVHLPGGLTPESSAMFGFFTYELRVGHAIGWSTAQGRLGRPLRVTGVQHPMPTLRCAVLRDRRGIEVSAPFADPTYEGQSLRPFPPATQLWVLLYAQVHQADGADMRNVLLGHRQAIPQPQRWERKIDRLRVDAGTATWSNAEIERLLELLALDSETPLSCLAVETLPGDQPIQDPVGQGLGYERFLRTSPLTPIPEVCV